MNQEKIAGVQEKVPLGRLQLKEEEGICEVEGVAVSSFCSPNANVNALKQNRRQMIVISSCSWHGLLPEPVVSLARGLRISLPRIVKRVSLHHWID
jgi:hypothetical protein